MSERENSEETVQVSIAGGTIEVLKSSLPGEIGNQGDMPVTLDEAKLYLRVDDTADDAIIADCLEKACTLCQAVARLDDEGFAREENAAAIKMAVLYALGYLYQTREGANHQELTKTLRAILMDVREEVF